jgi:hypothetical protein
VSNAAIERPRMSLAFGGRLAAVAVLTEAAGMVSPPDHQIEVTVITACAMVGAAILGQIVFGVFQRANRPPVDHAAEHADEQATLAIQTIDRLIEQIEERDQIIAKRDQEIARLRRHRDP